MIEVTLLALLQGIAEFLPISSSGHLVLGKELLGLGDVGWRLDIFLHVGTLLSICAFYIAVLKRIIVRREGTYLVKIAVSAIPVAVVGLLFQDALETALSTPRAVGWAWLFTGLVLTATRFLPRGDRAVGWGQTLAMGFAQAVAILPGVSRSGMTLVAARLSRVEAEKAAEFSFLMSVPPIAGAALLSVLKSATAQPDAATAVETSWPLTIFGCVVAGVVGYGALKLLLKTLKSDRFWLFGPYCLAVGVCVLVWTGCCGCR